MAIWKATGNKWIDSWQNRFIDFSNELESCACHNSPMTEKDREKCKKMMNSFRLMFNRYVKN